MESFELTLLVYVFSSFAILILLVTSNAFENVIETTLICRWTFDCSTNFKKEFKMHAEVSRAVFKIWSKKEILEIKTSLNSYTRALCAVYHRLFIPYSVLGYLSFIFTQETLH